MIDKFTIKIYQDVLYKVCWPAKKTYIRAKIPYNPGAGGCCYLAKNGIIVIDIDPRLTLQQGYDVFLHELGHVYMGHDSTMIITDLMNAPSSSGPDYLLDPEFVKLYKLTGDEVEAETFKKLLDARVDKARVKHKPAGKPIFQKYYILKHYIEEIFSHE